MIPGAVTLREAIQAPVSPFPGLRPFEFHESHLFFGRDGQVEKLMGKLSARRFLAVVGTSGSGKSSLVRAGLMPALRGGMMPRAGSKWRIAVMRPGNDPIGNLSRALNAPEVFGSGKVENTAIEAAVTEATLRLGSRGLIESVRQNGMPGNEYLLVIVDQFEELFRFADEARKSGNERFENEAAAFIKLLLEALATDRDNDHIYIVMTMRSDFLGDCARFWDLPEIVTESQYLIPRLTRDQLREVIEGPVAIAGGEIAPRLVTQLLNDIIDNQDQLPILQHALMRSWDEWKRDRERENPQSIDLQHYEAIGGMADALSRHADEAYDELPDDAHRRIAEKIFKALTDRGEDNREIRRPVKFGELCAVAKATQSQVVTVLNAFRQPRRSFLMPPIGAMLEDQTPVDISHESLIRVWSRLKKWGNEEAESAALYLRLAEAANRHREPWRGADLAEALDWRKKNLPNAAWAHRYHKDFDQAMIFLDESQEEAERELNRREAEVQARQKEERRKWKLRRAGRITFLIFLLSGTAALVYSAFKLQRKAKSEAQLNRQNFYVNSLREAQSAFDSGNRLRGDEYLIQFLPSFNAPPTNDLRDFYWRYLWKENHQELLTLKGHESDVTSIAFSPDGKTLASASLDQTVKLWDRVSGQVIATLKGHEGVVSSVAFSPDGKTLASASWDQTVKLWDRASGQTLATLKGHEGWVSSITFSPDGKILASAADDRTVKLWDRASGQALTTLRGHEGIVSSVAFSPDGKMLASASWDQTVKLWNRASGHMLATLKGHESIVSSVAFSPDGKMLASASDDRRVKLWDRLSGYVLATLEGHTDCVRAVAFSPDGETLASASWDQTVKLWDRNSGQALYTLKGHIDDVRAIAFSPDGKTLASASSDKTVKFWDRATGQPLAMLKGHEDAVSSVAFSPNGKTLASASWDQTVKLWDRVSMQLLATLKGHQDWVSSVAFSPDGKTLASTSRDQTIKLWDYASGQSLATLKGHEGWVSSVAFSPDGKTLASAADDMTVRLWDRASGKTLAILRGHEGEVYSVTFSPDGKTLASAADDKTVRLWDRASGKTLATLKGHEGGVYSVTFSPDGDTLASAGSDQTVRLWDCASGKALATLKGHEGWVSSVAFSPDGKTIASTGGDQTVHLWDRRSKRLLAKLIGHKGVVYSAAFSPDGKILATGGRCLKDHDGKEEHSGELRLWRGATDDEEAIKKSVERAKSASAN